jgi:hypothetical protein
MPGELSLVLFQQLPYAPEDVDLPNGIAEGGTAEGRQAAQGERFEEPVQYLVHDLPFHRRGRRATRELGKSAVARPL